MLTPEERLQPHGTLPSSIALEHHQHSPKRGRREGDARVSALADEGVTDDRSRSPRGRFYNGECQVVEAGQADRWHVDIRGVRAKRLQVIDVGLKLGVGSLRRGGGLRTGEISPSSSSMGSGAGGV